VFTFPPLGEGFILEKTMTVADKLKTLKSEIETFSAEERAIKQRIQELKSAYAEHAKRSKQVEELRAEEAALIKELEAAFK
jgi:SMC interacting uncharacterized protein involved in chromosome segregation